MADEEAEAAEVDASGWWMIFGFGSLWTLVCGGFATLALLAAAGVIGTSTNEPVNLGVVGVMLAMFSLGPALMYFGGSELATASRENDLRKQFPGKPWRWSERFNTGLIPANAVSDAFWAWYAALTFATFLAPFLLQLTIIKFDWRFLILVPFLVIDGFLFRFAWRRTYSAHRYGKLALQLSQLPLLPGSSFEATLKIPAALEGTAKARLYCDRTIVRKKGESRTDTVFETTKDVPIVASGANSVIKVAFDLPAEPNGLAFTWRVELTANGLEELFELPVFAAQAADVERFGQP